MIVSLVTTSFAQDAVVLNQGVAAPFTGILMTPVMAQDLRRAVIERDGSVQLNASYERSIGQYKLINEAQERKVGLLLDQNDKLSLRLGEERTSSFWEKTGYFALGIIATVGAGWALGQVQK